ARSLRRRARPRIGNVERAGLVVAGIRRGESQGEGRGKDESDGAHFYPPDDVNERPRALRPTSTYARTGAGSGGDRRGARFLRLMPWLQWRRDEHRRQMRRSLGKPYQREGWVRRKDARCIAAGGETSPAVVSILCRRRLVLARGIGRADDREWVKAEMTRSRKARNESLQRDRVGRNQRRGFADRSRQSAILAPAAGTRLGRPNVADLRRMAINGSEQNRWFVSRQM